MEGESVDPRLLNGGPPQGQTVFNPKSCDEKVSEAICISQFEFGKHRPLTVPTCPMRICIA